MKQPRIHVTENQIGDFDNGLLKNRRVNLKRRSTYKDITLDYSSEKKIDGNSYFILVYHVGYLQRKKRTDEPLMFTISGGSWII